ncbi:hypothetical protein NL676_033772 [Syzygium grande]|nr:hypothetical protein NL676_033772 [Syzygium grande]
MLTDVSLEKRGSEASEFSPIQNSAIPASQTSTQSLTPPSETFQADGNTNRPNQPSYFIKEQKISDDGYNWRKYGQKQAKGSEKPRSYYECTYPGCPTTKEVERSLDGHVTEIMYMGTHSHPKPLPTRRSSSQSTQPPFSSTAYWENPDQLASMACSEKGQQDSLASMRDEDVEENTQISNPAGDDDGSEPEAKRLRGENEYEGYSSSGNRTLRECRVVVRTTSEIDILDDGYRWQKYGQKVVKGNANPRSYYKCTNIGCPVRKHVERSSHDMRTLITTYEGQHNHDVPAAVAEERKTEVSTVDAKGNFCQKLPSAKKKKNLKGSLSERLSSRIGGIAYLPQAFMVSFIAPSRYIYNVELSPILSLGMESEFDISGSDEVSDSASVGESETDGTSSIDDFQSEPGTIECFEALGNRRQRDGRIGRYDCVDGGKRLDPAKEAEQGVYLQFQETAKLRPLLSSGRGTAVSLGTGSGSSSRRGTTNTSRSSRADPDEDSDSASVGDSKIDGTSSIDDFWSEMGNAECLEAMGNRRQTRDRRIGHYGSVDGGKTTRIENRKKHKDEIGKPANQNNIVKMERIELSSLRNNKASRLGRDAASTFGKGSTSNSKRDIVSSSQSSTTLSSGMGTTKMGAILRSGTNKVQARPRPSLKHQGHD